MGRRKSRAAPRRGKEEAKGSPERLQVAAAPSSQARAGQGITAPALAEWLLAVLLIGAAVAAYFNSFGGVFVLDDEQRIVNNRHIRQLWPPWAAMAQTSRPMVQVSLALNYAVGGANPWGYHAVNLAIHILAGLLLFGIVRRMLESDSLRARYGGASRWLAMAVAGIWLVHPLQTGSVTYLIQRTESLMGLFYLLTLYCGIRAGDSPRPRVWGIAAVVACALGMGSKEVMVSAPILMVLYDRMFIAGSFREAFRRRWGLYAGLAATWLVLGAALANNRVQEQEFMVAGLNPWSYAVTQCEVVVHYLRLAVWPDPLVFDYAWPIADPLWSVLPSAAVLLALFSGTVLALQRRVWVGFWGAWFFLILAPTSSILPIADVAFEHRMYLPLAAVVAAVVIGGHDLFRFLGRRLRVPARSRGRLEAGLVIAAMAVLGYETGHRNEDYRSGLALWSDTVAKRPENSRAHSNLGVALAKQGRHGEALTHFTDAVRLKPDYAIAQNNLGYALFKQGRNEEAIAHLTEAVRLRPRNADARSNLASALAKQGRTEEAATHFSWAESLRSASPQAHNALGNSLYLQGRTTEAIAEYSRAVRLKPDFTEALDNLRKAQASPPGVGDPR